LAHEVERRQKRNLTEHRFRAIARSFTLSTALPLSDEQRRQLQSDVALQQVVRAGDSIRAGALRLLAIPPGGAADATRVGSAEYASAAVELDIALPTETDRAGFVRAVIDAVRAAVAPFQAASPSSGSTPSGACDAAVRYRAHLVIYPAPADTPDDSLLASEANR
jgi:hypothetical protein